MDQKNANKKELQKENAKKGNHKCTKNANAKHIEIKTNAVSSKTQIAEHAFGHPLDSHLGERAGYAVSVAWFSCIQVLEFASHAICARMSFSSVWVSVPASTLEWAHRFSGKGGWHSPPA